MHALAMLVLITSALYLVSMMFSIGLRVGEMPKESKEEKRRKRRLLIAGLVLNLLVIPGLAFGLTRAVHASSDVTTGLLLLVAAPGGRYTPHLALLARGDVALAAELTIYLAKITGFTAAPVAKFMLDLKAFELRELPLVAQLLLLQLVPFYGGKWLGRKRLPFADGLRIGAHRFAVAMALLAFAAVLLEDRGIARLLHYRGWLAVLGVSLVAPMVGWLLGGRQDDARRTLAIGANASELGLALMMANLVFPGRGVHVALFGIWTLRSLASFFLSVIVRAKPASPAWAGSDRTARSTVRRSS
jgi:BASS family bile acid:Na+ symporter